MANEILSFEQIKAAYPNEWVLLSLQPDDWDTKSGSVLLHGKDYLELCYKGSEVAKHLLTTIFYTGKQKTNRKWLKAIHLK
jgi:hypothetical protein